MWVSMLELAAVGAGQYRRHLALLVVGGRIRGHATLLLW